MKYDVTVDADDRTTSHGLVVELVGTGKRVLDVGCATGYLARVLGQRGNAVSGVEIDPEAAEVARPLLDQLAVGDLETIDLVGVFGEHSFDVVVFADVLEHLRNPLDVLRGARGLLADDGFVVVSLPNIAHGAVRLALLQGRFEYRELGLLDDTHLRFFTRETAEDLIRGAGFYLTDFRRTKAGPFQTEIPLRAADFDAQVVEKVDTDPEASTYQFVIRAVPIGSSQSEVAMVNDLTVMGAELARLRGELDAISRPLAATPHTARLGMIVGHEPSPVDQLRIAALMAEMTRRLPGFGFRSYALNPTPTIMTATGDASYALLPWNEERALRVPGEIDAVVVVADQGEDANEPLRTILKDLEGSGLPIYVMATSPTAGQLHLSSLHEWDQTGSVQTVADLAALGSQLFSRPLLDSRLDYLRGLGHGPTVDRFAVVSFGDRPPADSPIWSALDSTSRCLDAELVVLDPSRESFRTPLSGNLDPLDLVALLANAVVVIADDPAIVALATSLARPAVAVVASDPGIHRNFIEWANLYDVLVTDGGGLVAAAELVQGLNVERTAQRMVADVEVLLDGLADAILSCTGRRFVHSVPQRLAELTDQVNVLEIANAGLRLVLGRERSAFAAYVQPGRGAIPPKTGPESRGAREALDKAEQEIAHLRFELDAVYGTRTMRTVQPARRVYSRLRSLRR